MTDRTELCVLNANEKTLNAVGGEPLIKERNAALCAEDEDIFTRPAL